MAATAVNVHFLIPQEGSETWILPLGLHRIATLPLVEWRTRFGVVVVGSLALVFAGLPGSAGAAEKPVGSLSQRTPLGLSGASPHADALPGGSARLYYPSPQTGGTAIADCTAAGACTVVGSIERIADLTDVVLADGSRRAYFVEIDPDTRQKTIFTAPMSPDGLSIGERTSLGFTDGGALAWGVPDSVVLPDERVRLYWVEPDPQGRMASEVIVSATSTDATGTVFVKDPGYRTTGGIVDFEVLRAEPGNWVAITSTTPEDPRNPQRLLLATSDDGLTWRVGRKSLTPSSLSFLDPTGIPITPKKFRIYYATAPNIQGDRDYSLEQATLTLGPEKKAEKKKKKKKKKKKRR